MSATDGGYPAPAGEGRSELRDRGSLFLAVVSPCADEDEAKRMLAAVAARHPEATHHCWAYRLGDPPRERSADAGEPGGTAGAPILQALRSAGLSDAFAVVTRWFGGVKLGKGGLVRAYGGAARDAVAATPVLRRVPVDELEVELPFARLGAVKRLLRPPEVELLAESYGETVRLRLRVQRPRVAALRATFAELGAREIAGED
ncbi:MAG: YigZ family protein [Holophagales bacterium]|jgi:uncharacterized YigZ family protein|nr:MAG: YigZ family protein [Holophagales bacterium]